MIVFSIIFGAILIADAIMFINGYKSYFWGAKTDQEKALRRKWFKDRDIEWNEKE